MTCFLRNSLKCSKGYLIVTGKFYPVFKQFEDLAGCSGRSYEIRRILLKSTFIVVWFHVISRVVSHCHGKYSAYTWLRNICSCDDETTQSMELVQFGTKKFSNRFRKLWELRCNLLKSPHMKEVIISWQIVRRLENKKNFSWLLHSVILINLHFRKK